AGHGPVALVKYGAARETGCETLRMVRFVLAVASALALVMFVGASVPSLAREAALPEDAGDSPFRYWPLADGSRGRLAGSGVEFEYAVVELEPGRYRVDALVNDFPVQREYYHADEAGWIATLREMRAGSFPLAPAPLLPPAPLGAGRQWRGDGDILPGRAGLRRCGRCPRPPSRSSRPSSSCRRPWFPAASGRGKAKSCRAWP